MHHRLVLVLVLVFLVLIDAYSSVNLSASLSHKSLRGKSRNLLRPCSKHRFQGRHRQTLILTSYTVDIIPYICSASEIEYLPFIVHNMENGVPIRTIGTLDSRERAWKPASASSHSLGCVIHIIAGSSW